MANETKPVDTAKSAPKGTAGAPEDTNPMKATGDVMQPTVDVSVENTVGNPSAGTEQQRQWASATTQAASTEGGNPTRQTKALFAKSSGEPIESVVVKKHQSDEGVILEAGATIYYQQKEGQPYPWPLLRPVDEKLHQDLKAEYDEYSEEVEAELRKNSATDELIRRVADRS